MDRPYSPGYSPLKLSIRPVSIYLQLLLGYFLLHTLIRLWLSPTLTWDEAEQVHMSEFLLISYNAQPPLYTWLQQAFFALLGTNLLAVVVLNNLTLAAIHALVFLLVYRIGKQRITAFIASGSVLFIPPLAVQPHQDLTHTLMATLSTLMVVASVLSLQEKPSTTRYTILGLVIGLALLSKHNIAMFLLLVLVTAAFSTRLQPLLRDRRLWLSVLIALAIFLPHVIAVIVHWDTEVAPTLNKMAGRHQDAGILMGLDQLQQRIFNSLWLFMIVAGLLYRFASTPVAKESLWQRHWLQHLLLAILVGLLLLVFAGARHFREAWLLPFLVLIPVWFGLVLTQRRLNYQKLWFAAITLAALASLTVVAARVMQADKLNKFYRVNYPYQAVIETLAEREVDFSEAQILTRYDVDTGNLKLAYPQATIGLTRFPASLARQPLKGDEVWLAWYGYGMEQEFEIPATLKTGYQRWSGCQGNFGQVHAIQAPMLYSQSKAFWFHYARASADKSRC